VSLLEDPNVVLELGDFYSTCFSRVISPLGLNYLVASSDHHDLEMLVPGLVVESSANGQGTLVELSLLEQFFSS
jgi:hypothetical protein